MAAFARAVELAGKSDDFAGHFAAAYGQWTLALAACDPERDREARERFREDTNTLATSWLASTTWRLGEVGLARPLAP